MSKMREDHSAFRPDKSNETLPHDNYEDASGELPPPYEEAAGSSRPRPNAPRPNASQTYPGQYEAQQQQYQTHAQHPQYPPQGPHGPFNYPPGYFCHQCRNTGIKQNGNPCGSCERSFGRQNGQVINAPYGMVPPNAVTYMAGDPRIGGRLCGNCKGFGIKSSLFGMVEEQCYVCRGVGRIL